MQKQLAILTFLFLAVIGKAQTGRVSGTILDSKTGETLPGATVLVEGTAKGASADFDGKFSINNVPAGKVTLVVSYISYTSKKISSVNVLANDVTDVNVQLDPSSSQDLEMVEVVVTLNKENNTALVLQQKNNASVSDGISAETIKRTPDRNTSDVLKRVSGASIQDNKFAIVRGLNERYNTSYLNGAPLPSTESDRKAFSFDVFPANMLDNLVITKTARPDMPGEFAGGIIEINTKNIPDKNFLSVSLGSGFNTITTGKDRLYYTGGKTDWLGFDDGTRSMPEEIPAYENFSNDVNKQAELAKQVPASDWGIYDNKKFLPNASFQISAGHNYKRKEKDFFGVLGSLTYNKTNTYFSTERNSFQSGEPNDPNNPLLADKTYRDQTFQSQVLTGALLNLSLKLNDFNSITLKNLYSIYSDDRTIERQGTPTPNESNPLLVKSTALWFTQNNIATSQLIGDHYLENSKVKISWNANFASVNRKIPNLRRHSYSRLTYLENKQSDPNEPPIYDPLDTVYKAELSQANSTSNEYGGNFLWSNLNEKVYCAKADVSRNFKINSKLSIEPKAGFLYQKRDRIFDFRQFIYSTYGGAGSSTVFNSSLTTLPTNQIFLQENMGLITQSTSATPNIGGFKLVETTQTQSDYTAGSILIAAYAMADVRYTEKWRLVAGIRYESYRQTLSYKDPRYLLFLPEKTFIEQDTTVNDWLPSANLIYSPNDKMNWRLSYSKTLNRPEFRELAPFIFYDFNTQFSLNGDPKLQRALINNYDVRWEWFPGAGQLISASGFYKKFENPIELFQSQNAQQIEYKNVPSAYVAGIEIEYRINLGNFYKNDSNTIGKILNNLTFFSNLALMKSEVDNSTLQGATYKRPMQGQSPYLLNAGISYVDNVKFFSVSVMYNRIGQRIYIVGNNLFQEIWEMPRDIMDFQITKGFFENKLEVRFNIKDVFAAGQPLVHLSNYDASRVTNKSTNTSPFWYQKMGSTYSFILSYKF
jgi:TonB-dependent receptor